MIYEVENAAAFDVLQSLFSLARLQLSLEGGERVRGSPLHLTFFFIFISSMFISMSDHTNF
jgi:hypothetical protein